MSNRTVVDCDLCGMRDVQSKPLVVQTDRRMDAAGSMEDVCRSVDLCPDCTRHKLKEFTDDLAYEDAQKWVRSIELASKRLSR